jgi:uncharacterized protein YdbL (DUF1318 family)
MTTLNEMIKIIETENPTLQLGNDQDGYIQMSKSEYDAKIAEWAAARLSKQTKIAEQANAKESAIAKFTALGLTSEEIAAIK